MSGRLFCLSVSVVMCLLPLVGGCGQTAVLELKFTPEDSSNYRLITENQKSLDVEGDLSSAAVEGGRTVRRFEMAFTQQIESVDDQGNATAKITVKELKYFDKVKERIDADFDSTDENRNRGPLGRLIGQSYSVKISPAGKVISVVEVGKARAAIRGGTPAHDAAKRLLQSPAITARHTIPALPAAGENRIKTGESWSNIRNFNYRMMGSDTYERVYTLKEIKASGGHRIAFVEMTAIPSAETADELAKAGGAGAFSNMFDSTKKYTGRLKLDLTTGKIEEYIEKMQTNWVAVDQETSSSDVGPPPALKIGVVHTYSLKRTD